MEADRLQHWPLLFSSASSPCSPEAGGGAEILHPHPALKLLAASPKPEAASVLSSHGYAILWLQ